MFQKIFVVTFRKNINYFQRKWRTLNKRRRDFSFWRQIVCIKTFSIRRIVKMSRWFVCKSCQNEQNLEIISSKVYWFDLRNHEQNMFANIFEFVKKYFESCAICKRNKTFKHKFFEKFQSLFVSQYKWSNFTMNFVINLSTNKNWNSIKYDNILVVINRFTKMNHYVSIIKTIKIKNLTKMFIKKIIQHHEFFTFIIIDRDLLFTFEYCFFLYYVLKIKIQRL